MIAPRPAETVRNPWVAKAGAALAKSWRGDPAMHSHERL
jgi:hypothetical protein